MVSLAWMPTSRRKICGKPVQLNIISTWTTRMDTVKRPRLFNLCCTNGLPLATVLHPARKLQVNPRRVMCVKQALWNTVWSRPTAMGNNDSSNRWPSIKRELPNTRYWPVSSMACVTSFSDSSTVWMSITSNAVPFPTKTKLHQKTCSTSRGHNCALQMAPSAKVGIWVLFVERCLKWIWIDRVLASRQVHQTIVGWR